MTTDPKLVSINQVKNKIRQMHIENYEAIKLLNRYLDAYLARDIEINVIIPFPEMNKDIYVQLLADPSLNIVMFKQVETTEQPEESNNEQNANSQVVLNSCSKEVFSLSDLERVKRFICIGTEGGSYYINEKKLTIENIKALERILNNEDKTTDELVNTLELYSSKVYKKDYILLVLARCCAVKNDTEFKQRCFRVVSNICSTPTLLFLFIEFYQSLNKTLYDSKGWNKHIKSCVSEWYNNRPDDKLLYQVLKYQNRNGWCHKDVLRLAHVIPIDEEHNYIYQFLTKGTVNENMDNTSKKLIDIVKMEKLFQISTK